MFEELGKAGCPSIDGLYYSASSKKTDMYAKSNAGMFKRCEKEVPCKIFQRLLCRDRLRDPKAALSRCPIRTYKNRTWQRN